MLKSNQNNTQIFMCRKLAVHSCSNEKLKDFYNSSPWKNFCTAGILKYLLGLMNYIATLPVHFLCVFKI